MDEILYASAAALAQAIGSGKLSSAEVVEAHLKRIDEVNPRLNAVVQLRAEAALEDARRADADRVRRLVERAGLPTAMAVDPNAMLDAMGMDKKVVDGRIRLVVCDGIGQVTVTSDAPPEAIRAAIVDG